jgi:hypothetical protein
MGEWQKGASTGGGRHGGVGTRVRKSEEKDRTSFVADRKDSTGRGCTIRHCTVDVADRKDSTGRGCTIRHCTVDEPGAHAQGRQAVAGHWQFLQGLDAPVE